MSVPPQDSIPQRQLVYRLALAIDNCMSAEMASPGAATLRWANLHVLLEENPRSAFSTHVLHNIGARRTRWLLAYAHSAGRDARLRAGSATSNRSTHSSDRHSLGRSRG